MGTSLNSFFHAAGSVPAEAAAQTRRALTNSFRPESPDLISFISKHESEKAALHNSVLSSFVLIHTSHHQKRIIYSLIPKMRIESFVDAVQVKMDSRMTVLSIRARDEVRTLPLSDVEKVLRLAVHLCIILAPCSLENLNRGERPAGRAQLLAKKGASGRMQRSPELSPVRNSPECEVRNAA